MLPAAVARSSSDYNTIHHVLQFGGWRGFHIYNETNRAESIRRRYVWSSSPGCGTCLRPHTASEVCCSRLVDGHLINYEMLIIQGGARPPFEDSNYRLCVCIQNRCGEPRRTSTLIWQIQISTRIRQRCAITRCMTRHWAVTSPIRESKSTYCDMAWSLATAASPVSSRSSTTSDSTSIATTSASSKRITCAFRLLEHLFEKFRHALMD